MLVKFMRHGQGRGEAPINYLLGRLRDREGARVLYGDPVITEQLVNISPFKNKYKSGVLSFTEQADSLSEAQKRNIMQRFEETIFVGLEPDQYDILWVEHSDKGGRLELNFVIPCIELRSGKSFQPFYAGADLVRVNAFKNMINHEYKLSDPDDPKRRRLVNPYVNNAPRPSFKPKDKTKSYRAMDEELEEIIKTTRRHSKLKEAVDKRLQLLVEQQYFIGSRDDILRHLRQWEFKIERVTKNSISISHPNVDKNIRLKGFLYEENFNADKIKPHRVEFAQERYDSTPNGRYLHSKQVWQVGIQKKYDYHKARYGNIKAPEPFELTPKVRVTPKAPQPVPEPESAYSSFRP